MGPELLCEPLSNLFWFVCFVDLAISVTLLTRSSLPGIVWKTSPLSSPLYLECPADNKKTGSYGILQQTGAQTA
jgi:hypothetical protein